MSKMTSDQRHLSTSGQQNCQQNADVAQQIIVIWGSMSPYKWSILEWDEKSEAINKHELKYRIGKRTNDKMSKRN